MPLNTAEQFLLLVQHPEKQQYILDSNTRALALVGAMLMDLSALDCVSLRNDYLMARMGSCNGSETHKQMLKLILDATEDKKLKDWIQQLSKKAKVFEKELHEQMAAKNWIKIIPKRFLFWRYYRTQLLRSEVRTELREELRNVIFSNRKVSARKAGLLGLIDACNLHKLICKNKREVKQCKRQLKHLIEKNAISQEVSELIKEMQAAINAALIASTVVTTTAATSGS